MNPNLDEIPAAWRGAYEAAIEKVAQMRVAIRRSSEPGADAPQGRRDRAARKRQRQARKIQQAKARSQR